MNDRVLILNQDYRALAVCSVQKAFVLLYLNKAEMVNGVESHFLRSVTTSYPLPSVIRLHQYVNVPYRNVILSRQNIFRRDKFQCQYCGSKNDLTLDHVTPRSKGGPTSWENLITACRRCNGYKGDHKPEEVGLKLRYLPYRPSFVMFLRDYTTEASGNSWDMYLGKSG